MKITAATDLRVWKASYLANRFDLSVDAIRSLKTGEVIDVEQTTGEKMVQHGFADAITQAEPEPAPEMEEDDGC